MKIEDEPHYTETPELPFLNVDMPVRVTNSQILERFTKSCALQHFQVIEQVQTQATAVYKEKPGPFSFLFCFVPRKDVLSAVKLNILLNQVECKRKVILKGIYGYAEVIDRLISTFTAQLEVLLEASIGLKNPQVSAEMGEEEEPLTCKHESASYYQIHRMLSSDQYTVGQTLIEFCRNFQLEFHDLELSANQLPLPMNNVKSMLSGIVAALVSDYNCGNSNIVQYCRPAVEKFVFTKLYKQLFKMYKFKAKSDDSRFREIRAGIEITDPELMEKLEIEEKFRLGEDSYKEAVYVLNVIENYRCPLDKLNCLLTMVAAMRSAVVEFWKNKRELHSIDDELSVLMFVLLKSSIKYPHAQIMFLRDYVGNSFENERRILINTETSLHFVTNSLSLI